MAGRAKRSKETIAETGLPGFILFLAFYLALLADALGLLYFHNAMIKHKLQTSSAPAETQVAKTAGWLAAAGIFTLGAVMLQGFSQDSFAMPELWINLGIMAGAAGCFPIQKN